MIRHWKREEDYPLAVEWWIGHGKDGTYIPLAEFLPRAGFVVESADGVPLCMGWLVVFADVPAAQTGYIVTNPANGAGDSAEAIRMLFEEMGRTADTLGIRLVARYDNEGILNIMKNCGWSELVRNQVEMIRLPGGAS
jgi:hypothetical protein